MDQMDNRIAALELELASHTADDKGKEMARLVKLAADAEERLSDEMHKHGLTLKREKAFGHHFAELRKITGEESMAGIVRWARAAAGEGKKAA